MDDRFNYVIDTYLWSAASALAGMSTFSVPPYLTLGLALIQQPWFDQHSVLDSPSLVCPFPLSGTGPSVDGADGIASQMYEKLGTQWASSLLGFLALVMAPIPMVLYVYGPKLRARSRYSPS